MTEQVAEGVRWILESVSEDDHSKFSPSSAHRWMPCPGSMALELDYPNESSEYADEGTAAHAILADCLQNETDAETHMGEIIVVRQLRKDGSLVSEREYPVDGEMAGFVQATIDSVRRRLATKTLLVEQRVWFTKAIGTLDKQGGTSDIIMVSHDGEEVDVEDFKYGMGVKVYAAEIEGYEEALDPETGEAVQVPIKKGNKQMLSYALGVLEQYGGILGDFKRFNLRVHQPRIDWEDEFTVSVEDVIAHGAAMRSASLNCAIAIENRGYKLKELDEQGVKDKGQRMEIVAADLPIDFFSPGEKQCRFCRAKPTCRALAQKVAADVYDDFEALDTPEAVMVSHPRTPAGERLGALYGALGQIRDWCNAVEAECERQVFAGMTVIGPDGQPMKLVEGKKGDRYWLDEEVAEASLAGTLAPDQLYAPQKIVSVAKAQTAVCAGIKGKGSKAAKEARWEPFKVLVGQSPGNPKIALGSDPRPVYQGEAKDDEFTDLTDPSL